MGLQKLQSLSEDILKLFWLLYDFCACQILKNSFNSFQTRGTGTETFHSPTTEYTRVHHPYWPCIISTVAKEIYAQTKTFYHSFINTTVQREYTLHKHTYPFSWWWNIVRFRTVHGRWKRIPEPPRQQIASAATCLPTPL